MRRLLLELRPAWWVLRGYLLIAVPCALAGQWDFPFPYPLGSSVLGLLLTVGAIAGSVALGRRERGPRLDRLIAVAGAFLGFVGFVLAVDSTGPSSADYGYVADSGYAPAPVLEQAVGQYPLVSRYGPVTDVLPFDAEGAPLEGVLLYDQDGRPLQVGFQEWWADGCARELRQPLADDGVPVANVFPQQYVLDGSGRDLNGVPVPLGSCDATVQRPDVAVPQFPASTSVSEATPPGD
ncbi:hypothetical protein A7K94_0209775 [Modestobacter sp. VKM Ac-2676]|nr:hypothetical protein A7K94_0209775 [Modestobacter sp. VKM Ac-2676]